MKHLQIPLKTLSKIWQSNLILKFFLDYQQKWELLKYEIRRFAISYCKQRTKKYVGERKYLENKLKNLENVLDNYENLESYHHIKSKIEEIYENKA